MKKLLIAFSLVLFLFSTFNFAVGEVKIGYVNSDRILSEFDEARQAQEKLDAEARKLENEYRAMLARLDSLNQEYERQQLIMSDARRLEKEQEITSLQRAIQEFQIEKLGPEGEIYKKQAELVGPVIDKINKIIKKIGKEEKYDYIFDTVAGNILYAEPVYDLTDKVIYELTRTK